MNTTTTNNKEQTKMNKLISKAEFPKFVSWLVANGYKKLPKGLEAYEAVAMYYMDKAD